MQNTCSKHAAACQQRVLWCSHRAQRCVGLLPANRAVMTDCCPHTEEKLIAVGMIKNDLCGAVPRFCS